MPSCQKNWQKKVKGINPTYTHLQFYAGVLTGKGIYPAFFGNRICIV